MDAGIAITGVASYVRVGSDVPDDVVLGALVGALDLAADLGAPFVRVFPGAPAEPCGYDTVPTLTEPREEVADRAARRLDAVAGFAEEVGVRPALETHDSHPTGALVADVLSRVAVPGGRRRLGPHAPLAGRRAAGRHLGRAAARGWRTAAAGSRSRTRRCPVARCPCRWARAPCRSTRSPRCCAEAGYDGVVSLEWERMWYPDAAPLEVASASFRRWADAVGLAA